MASLRLGSRLSEQRERTTFCEVPRFFQEGVMVRRISRAAQALLAAFCAVGFAATTSQAEPPAEAGSTETLHLEQALARRVTASFTNVPLEKVVSALSEKTG